MSSGRVQLKAGVPGIVEWGAPSGSLEAGAVSIGQVAGGGPHRASGDGGGRVCGRGVMSPPGSLRLELKKGLGVTRTLCCVFTFLDGRSWSVLACWREGSRRGLGSSPEWAEAGLASGAVLEERAGRQGGGPGDEGAGADAGSHGRWEYLAGPGGMGPSFSLPGPGGMGHAQGGLPQNRRCPLDGWVVSGLLCAGGPADLTCLSSHRKESLYK